MSFALGFHNDLKEIISLETHSLDCVKIAFYLSYNHFNPTVSKSVRNEEMKMNRAVMFSCTCICNFGTRVALKGLFC